MTARILTKKQLCLVFGLFSENSQRCYYQLLRKKVFTDEALEAIGMTAEQYHRMRSFDAKTSERIIEYFSLNPSEFNEL